VYLELHEVVRHRHDYPDPHGIPRGCVHSTAVIALHRVANGSCSIGSESWMCRGPFIALVAAGESNANLLRGRNEAWWCRFQSPAVAQVAGGGAVTLGLDGRSLRRPHFRAVAAGELEGLERRFAAAHAAWRRSDLAGRLAATAAVADLLSAWCRPAPTTDPVQGLADRYRALIEESACRPGTALSELAERLGHGADHLARLFRRTFGMSPVAYRDRVRLTAACELLLTGNQDLAATAQSCGFANPGHLGRHFKARFGLPPAAWARQHRLHGHPVPG
jgi:AraC-like DNA-binding protein